MPQLNYGLNQAVGFPGLIQGVEHDCQTYIAGEAIGFGLGVVHPQGGIDDARTLQGEVAVLPAIAAEGDFRGITVAQHGENSYPQIHDSNEYKLNDNMTVMRKGQIIAQINPEDALVDQANTYVQPDGKFCITADGNTYAPGVVIRRINGYPEGLALVEINLWQPQIPQAEVI